MLPYAVLTLLVALNVSLLAMLFWQRDNVTAEPATQDPASPTVTPSASTATPTPTPASTPTPSTSQTPSAGPTSASVEQVRVIPAKRLLVADTGREAWRATVGDCSTPGRVERSTNRGKSWKRVVETSLAPIVRLGTDQGNHYVVGGADPNCSTRYVAYSTAGGVLGQTDAPQGLWFLDPDERDRVVGPGNAMATPCKQQHVVGLAALDLSKAVVICGDGVMMATSSSGMSWNRVANVPGTMAVAAGTGRYWIAGFNKACDGISVRPVAVDNNNISQGQRGCVKVSKVGAGEVALGVSEDTVWLWAGDNVSVSANGGRSWD